MVDVPAAIMTAGTFACVATGPTESASGVRPKPPRTATLSLTTSSVARRLVWSAAPVSSLMMSWIFLPATVSPFCAIHRRAPASIWRPVEAEGPVIGRMRPTLTVSCASAGRAAKARAAAPTPVRICLRSMSFLPRTPATLDGVRFHVTGRKPAGHARWQSSPRGYGRAQEARQWLQGCKRSFLIDPCRAFTSLIHPQDELSVPC